MKPNEIVSMLGAFAQISKRGGAATVQEATTALQRMSDDIVDKSDKFKKLGVEVFEYERDATGRKLKDARGKDIRSGLRNPMEIFREVMAVSGGDIKTIKGLFGIRGMKAGGPIFSMAQGFAREGGRPGDLGFGWSEMMKEFDKFFKAQMTGKELEESAAFAREGAGFKWNALVERFSERVGPRMIEMFERLEPTIEKMIPMFEKIVEAGAGFVEWLAENPYEGIGAIIAASVAKDIAAAKIGQIIARMLGAPGPGVPGPVPAPAIPPAAGGGLLTSLLALGIPLAAAGGIVYGGTKYREAMKDTENFGKWWNVENPHQLYQFGGEEQGRAAADELSQWRSMESPGMTYDPTIAHAPGAPGMTTAQAPPAFQGIDLEALRKAATAAGALETSARNASAAVAALGGAAATADINRGDAPGKPNPTSGTRD
jgi:hypothetical protein